MKPKIISIETAISPAQLEAAEKELGVFLPEPYRDFLLEYNGGQPVPSTFRLADGKSLEVIGWFFSIQNKDDGLVNLAKTYQAYLHGDLLPIAADPFGNLICLGVKGRYIGQIYFWLHERELPSNTPLPNAECHLVASSFDEFMGRFVEGERNNEH